MFSWTQGTALFLCVDTGHSSLPMKLCPILEPSRGIQGKRKGNSIVLLPKQLSCRFWWGLRSLSPGLRTTSVGANVLICLLLFSVSQFPNVPITFHQPSGGKCSRGVFESKASIQLTDEAWDSQKPSRVFLGLCLFLSSELTTEPHQPACKASGLFPRETSSPSPQPKKILLLQPKPLERLLQRGQVHMPREGRRD